MTDPAPFEVTALDVLLKPSKFFARLRFSPPPWILSGGLYFFSIIAASFFYAFKPAGFPQGSLGAEAEPHGVLFWLGIGAISGLLTLGVAGISRAILKFLSYPSVTVAQLAQVLFASHFYYLALFVFLGTASWLRSEALYKTSELFFSLAGLVFTVKGYRYLARATIAKAFLSLFLSSLIIMAAMLALMLAGILPSPVFRALLLM